MPSKYNQSNLTQDLFDYVVEQTEVPVASTSGISETSKTPEPVIGEPETSKLSDSFESSNKVVNLSPKETSVKHDLG